MIILFLPPSPLAEPHPSITPKSPCPIRAEGGRRISYTCFADAFMARLVYRHISILESSFVACASPMFQRLKLNLYPKVS